MPTYKVHICRIGYSHLDITVEASSEAKAGKNAQYLAGNYVFPSENHSEYTVEGITKIEEVTNIDPLVAAAMKRPRLNCRSDGR